MSQLAKAFLDIALWRQTPAHLPASMLLLALCIGASILMEVIGALLPPPPHDQLLARIAIGVMLPLAFTWIVLHIAQRRQRYLQTSSALLGVGVLAEIILYPLGSLLRVMDSERISAVPIGILWYVILIWYLVVCAHIWRSALDSGMLLGGVLSLGFLVLSIVIERQLVLQT